ncbi:MAG: winged helix-turn-helix transcriptional regulator [Roseivirga sp.]|nr:winged helix-turn-helix transcriptional regulator [Roseivirga sp.]
MNSAFDREKQQEDLDSRLVVAFEKMAEVFRVLLWDQAKVHGLSPIQMQILIFLKNHEPALGRPAILASELNVTKPTISDALKSLVEKGLIASKQNPNDSRSRLLSLKSKGASLTAKIESFSHPLQEQLSKLGSTEKSIVLERMLTLIDGLAAADVISPQRMCYNCSHYKGDRHHDHHCLLLEKRLSKETLRIDCPEHSLVS